MANLPTVREESAFELGKVFAESGMFPNVRKAAEAVVKIIAGREFGLGPMAAMNGIHMVDGKPTLAANLIAGQIKRHPKYNYKVVRREDNGCELEFFEDNLSVGRMTWSEKDAKAASLLGKRNWKSYPRDMYFARCLTSGARTYCPDVLGGTPIYTAEELDAEVPETAPATPEAPSTVAPEETATDAVVVPDGPEVIDASPVDREMLGQLRTTYEASGKDHIALAWCLLSIGVDLPSDPKEEDVAKVMPTLTREQAWKLDALLKDEDPTLPGSGEGS